MLKMSFYDGSLDRERLVGILQQTQKPIKYTYGFVYRNPTTYKVEITMQEAVKIVKREGLLDAEEFDDYIHLNAFSENDMW